MTIIRRRGKTAEKIESPDNENHHFEESPFSSKKGKFEFLVCQGEGEAVIVRANTGGHPPPGRVKGGKGET